MDLILSRENILLAYRSIKTNTGSQTPGVNKHTIKFISKMEEDRVVNMVRGRLSYYCPSPVRRVEILKENGKTRPLGIPTIEERIIQQCIKQILEPILEAKFYKHSYGFRPDRSTEYAVARFEWLAFKGYHYVVDIDIKGFFDNVNHGKLLKQLWTLGIRDKQLLKIISLMLKAEVKGIGIPDKGTPQGGILSPLLANVVLNELDWWIASQWDLFPAKYQYNRNDVKQAALRKTKLKDIWIIRYSDDFKIMCKDHITARKIFKAVKMWLKERLSLEISKNKSKITNLRKNYSGFLGFKLKVRKGKNNKYTNRSHMLDKAKTKAVKKLKEAVKMIQKHPTGNEANKYNSVVLGLQNYYRIATMVNKDFSEIAFKVKPSLECRTRNIRSPSGKIGKTYNTRYGEYSFKQIFINNVILFPIAAIKFNPSTLLNPKICRYTNEGRQKIHDNLKINTHIVRYLMHNPVKGRSIEFNDNRISLYCGQEGKCGVSGQILEIGRMIVHHIILVCNGGTDQYNNLIFITEDVHHLIHDKDPQVLAKYMKHAKLNKKGLEKLNKLRILAGNDVIVNN
jgi:group II intron reverse transcriptase/maturase